MLRHFWLALALFCSACEPASEPVRNITPAIQSLTPSLLEGSIYADLEAAQLLAEKDPTRFAELPTTVRERHYQEIASNPAHWRRLDREHRFTLILWAGDPANARALFQHLLQARDWVPVYLDSAVIAFARSGKKWATDQANFPDASPDELARIAARLIAINENTSAEQILTRSHELDPSHHDTLVLMSTLAAARERWHPALEHARAALVQDKNSAAALYLESQALFALGKAGEAARSMDRLIKIAPDNPTYLFLEAKIAHELSQFEREIRSLQTIISALQAREMATTFYEIYLAQAYASNGENTEALRYFEELAKRDDLTPGQTDFVTRAITRLREGVEK